MALPRNNVPTFELTQPSNGAKVKYRPWLVGEQKSLMMALEGGDADILLAVKNAVNTCTFGVLDVESMPNFDLEYIFLQIRTKSAGESVEMVLTCQHCGEQHERALNLSDVGVVKTDGHNTKLILGPALGVEMRYLTTDELNWLNKNYSVDSVYKMVMACIYSVFTDEEVSYTKDEPAEEIEAFLNSLTQDQYNIIEDFFRTMPALKHSFVDTCPSCGKDTQYTLEGIEAFFV